MNTKYLTVIALLAAGCGPKDPAAHLPGPAYTLTLRGEQQGDRTEVVQETTRITTTLTTTTHGTAKSSGREYERFEFSEEIVAMPAGAAIPTEVKRFYKVAMTGYSKDFGEKFAIAEKTVVVKKTPTGVAVTADGQPLAPLDEVRFKPMFERKDERVKNELVLPKKPVKVGEIWKLAPEDVSAAADALKIPIQPDKSQGTVKLVNTQKKDDQQWSTIEATIEFDVNGTYKGRAVIGSLTLLITLEAVTDGSADEGSLKMNLKGKFRTNDGHNWIEYQPDVERNETRKPTK